MNEFFGSVWWLVVTLGVLVTFHEYGHFVVARLCGVKVLKFSIGFGPALWSRRDRRGTQFAVSAIPLGGYVKMLDEREADDTVDAAELEGAHNRQPVGRRMAIAAAGPAFNLVFTVLAFWLMFVIGKPDYQPVVDAPKGLAAEAGVHAGDRILAVGGTQVASWSAAMAAVTEAAALHRDVALELAGADGAQRRVTLALSRPPPGAPDNDAVFDRIGLDLQPQPPIADSVENGMPAARAGMQAGDRIVAVDGVEVASFTDFSRVLAERAAQHPTLEIVVDRGGVRVPLQVAPTAQTADGRTRWIIGIAVRAKAKDALEQFGPLRAIPAAFAETWNTARSTLGMIKSMLVGEASTKNLSSVISIAQVANASAHQGPAWFLNFLAIISLSLAILNLLPIPILDGGQLLYYLIELVKGSPVSESVQIAGQYVGLTLLMALMGLAFYNDILRIAS